MEQSYALTEAIVRHPSRKAARGSPPSGLPPEAAGVEVRFSTTQLAGTFEAPLRHPREPVTRPDGDRPGYEHAGWVLKIETATGPGRCRRRWGVRRRFSTESCSPVSASAAADAAGRAGVAAGDGPGRQRAGHRTHMAGAAVDISVLRRADGAEVWRGKPYLEIANTPPLNSPFVTAEERQNRQESRA